MGDIGGAYSFLGREGSKSLLLIRFLLIGSFMLLCLSAWKTFRLLTGFVWLCAFHQLRCVLIAVYANRNVGTNKSWFQRAGIPLGINAVWGFRV